MGKGGGKGGKSGLAKAVGIAGMVWGGIAPGVFGLAKGAHLVGAIMGLSLGQTIGAALSDQNANTPASNFDSKMNTVDSGARIPLVYGTRMIGGLQSWHQTNTDKKWLIKDVILGEGNFCGSYGVTANGFMLKPNGSIPTIIRQYATNNKWYGSVSSGNNPVFGLINWKYADASVEIRKGGPTGNDKQLILRWNGQEKWITMQSNVDLKDDASNDYSCQFSLLYQYLEGIHYDTNFAAEGWQLVNPVMASDDPETINTHGQQNCYKNPVMFTIGDYRATNDSWVQFFNGQQDAPSYYEKSGGYPNMAYLHAYLKYTDKLGAGNPTVTCIAHGRAVYDTRTGQWGYSENPAMIVRDYLLNKTFGAGHFITEDMLDEDSFKDVADYCDEIITTTDGAGRSIVEPRYRLNIVINDKNTYLQTLQSMLASFVGFIVFTNGKVALKIERAENAVYDFNDDNIIEDSLSYKADSTADSPNKLVMKYIEPVLNWTAAPAVVEDLVDQADSPIGRGKVISKDVELIGVTSQAQALRLGKIYRDIIRLCPITISFKSGAQAMHLEPGDIVKINHKMVVDGKEVDLFKDMPVRILEIQEGQGEYTLTCRQYNPSIYDDRFGGNLNIHDYTPTVKPEDVLPAATPQPTDLKLSTIYKQAADGSVRYDLIVDYTLDTAAGVETGLVYFKTNEDYDLSNIGVIAEDVKGDEIGFSKDWQYAGDSPTKFIFPNVNVGTTYKVMVRARSKNGETSAESGAPTATITIARKSTVPNMPSNFSFKFSDPPKFTWDAVTNSDVDFYELRYDEHAGEKDGLITRTASTSVSVQLTNRTGKLYLFAHNATKKYGYPAILTYSKALPPTPKAPVLTTKLGGFSIETDPIPDDCVGMVVYISAAGSENVDKAIQSPNNVYSYMCKEGIYDVQVAYRDIFGEGNKSPISTITVKVLVDDSFIKDESISIGKVDQALKDSIDAGAEAKQQIVDMKSDIKTSIDELKAADEGLKQTDTELSNTITQNKTDQDGVNATFKSQIKQNADGVSSIVANLGDPTKANQEYKAFSQIKQTTDSITSTVASNKAAQDKVNTDVASQIKQTAGSISSVVANLSDIDKATDAYGSFSALKQTIDGISTSVNKQLTDQNGKITTLSSQITQTADKITTVVNNLNGDPSKSTYSALTQLSDAINLRVKSDDIINQINISKESILIDGKKVHITGDTVFDNNVIAKGMIQAGAITADKLAAQDITIGGDTSTTTGIVGGAVRLDQDGLTVTQSNGTATHFNENGMTFTDSAGNAFAGIGRFCTGQVNDGDTVTFNTPWDIVPAVFLFPTQLQTSVVQYTNVNVYQQVMPTNVSEKGFTAICRSILKAGSGSNVPVNYVYPEIKSPFFSWTPDNAQWEVFQSYSIQIPSTATIFSCQLSFDSKGYWNHIDDTIITVYVSANIDIQVKLDGDIAYSQTVLSNAANVTSTTGGSLGGNKGITVSTKGKTNVEILVRGWGIKKTKGRDQQVGAGAARCHCTLLSYSINAEADTVISRGSCGFIAVDPNTVPFTVTKGS